ncbi:hypothetical protein ACU5EH_02945 [Aliivibrio salmonicida]|uniref:hypothetical protein n=1 Tax=Aliivibrio salmonicida TaxID=40269 RepID=UPI00406CF237
MSILFRHIAPLITLSGTLLISGCGDDNATPEFEVPPPSEVATSLTVHPVMLLAAIPASQSTMISMSSSIQGVTGKGELTLSLTDQSSPSCDVSPVVEGHNVTMHPSMNDDTQSALCSYDYTVAESGQSAQSTLSFAVSNTQSVTPALSWIGGIGSVGDAIEATITAAGVLSADVIVLGDKTETINVDVTGKTITFTGTVVGVTRVMYTLTNGSDVQVGVVDFTVSEDITVAPTAARGDAVLPTTTSEKTYDLTNFTPISGGAPISLVQARDSDGTGTGTTGLSITKVLPALGINASVVAPLSIKVTATRSGVFPIYYLVSDGLGGMAYNMVNVVVEGPAGLLVRDARYSLEPTGTARTLTIDTADFVTTSSGVAQLELVPGSIKITSKQAPSSTGYIATAAQVASTTAITYSYTGNNKNGISNITYKIKDKLTNLITDGNIFVSVGNQLPQLTSMTVTGVAAGASPTVGTPLKGVAVCDTATGCELSKTKWEWRQSGDAVLTGVGPSQSDYTVQSFFEVDTLELRTTPVGTFTANGVTKDVEGLPTVMQWTMLHKPPYCHQFPGATDLNCLPTVTVASGKIFTANMSQQFIRASYSTLSYTSLYNENGSNGHVGVYVRTNHVQSLAMCSALNTKNQYGRNNWRLASKDELLTELYGEYGDMFDARGWPTYYVYWSGMPRGSDYYRVDLGNGYVSSKHPSGAYYASCVSVP